MIEPSPFNAFLGAQSAEYLRAAEPLARTLLTQPVRFLRAPEEEFRRLMETNPEEGLVLYWRELLSRAHFTAIGSFLRGWKWLQAMQWAHSAELFLPFCAALRALIEATADAQDGLSGAAKALAENKNSINMVLRRRANFVLTAPDLEEQLIHFSHARKVDRGETADELHNAKAPHKYIQQLKLQGLYELYGLLCQFTHPAAPSVQYLVQPWDDHHFLVVADGDAVRIKALVQSHEELVYRLLMLSFNSPAVILKVLLRFDEPAVHTPAARKMDLSSIELWRQCEQLFRTPVRAA
jgi:hypothetical protein